MTRKKQIGMVLGIVGIITMLMVGMAGGASYTKLEIEGQNYMPHNSTQDIEVYYYEYNGSIDEIEKTNVTDSATIVSNNTSVISVNGNTLESTNDTNLSALVPIEASYNGHTAIKGVTVAEIKLKNVNILPAWYHIPALMGSQFGGPYQEHKQFQWLFMLLIISVFVTRMTNSWVGIAITDLGLILGWAFGWITLGLVISGIFISIFLALQLKETIVVGGQRLSN